MDSTAMDIQDYLNAREKDAPAAAIRRTRKSRRAGKKN